jgi:tRNA pseudouridine(38-40) synthase
MLAEAAKTFKLIIEYDGSAFHGWQRQKKDRTVQETIENALAVMTREGDRHRFGPHRRRCSRPGPGGRL